MNLLYPRPYHRKEQEDQRKRDAARYAEELERVSPLLKQVVERLNQRIAHYDSLASVDTSLTVRPKLFQKQMQVNKAVQAHLIQERDYIVSVLRAKKEPKS